mgnify:CR=1 FL=1
MQASALADLLGLVQQPDAAFDEVLMKVIERFGARPEDRMGIGNALSVLLSDVRLRHWHDVTLTLL